MEFGVGLFLQQSCEQKYHSSVFVMFQQLALSLMLAYLTSMVVPASMLASQVCSCCWMFDLVLLWSIKASVRGKTCFGYQWQKVQIRTRTRTRLPLSAPLILFCVFRLAAAGENQPGQRNTELLCQVTAPAPPDIKCEHRTRGWWCWGCVCFVYPDVPPLTAAPSPLCSSGTTSWGKLQER